MSHHENVGFTNSSPGFESGLTTSGDSTFQTSENPDTTLAAFMARPVRIGSFTWNIGSELSTVPFNPWALFFDQSTVRDKLHHFALLRCTLRVKFVLNGTPFHIGRAYASYCPYSASADIDRVNFGVGVNENVIYSQRPKVFLDPTTSTGGTLALPFFYDDNYWRILDKAWDQMGFITMKTLTPLDSANGTLNPVSVQVYAWAEDVSLQMPTKFLPQSGYEGGVLSKPATVIAKSARTLANVPWIGSYAIATANVASAFSSIASIFGYARPTLLADPCLVVPRFTGNFTNTNTVDTCEKLTLDAKQELTIDPTTVGLDSKDEMAFANIVTKESYISQFQWSATQQTDTLLASFKVTPMMFVPEPTGVGVRYFMTPSCVVGNSFRFWKGSMKFRFQIVVSALHRGRLKFVYEPSNQLTAGPVPMNTNYTHVVDLAEASDFTVCCGWGSNRTFLRTGAMNPANLPYSSGGLVTPNSEEDNGTLSVYVVNEIVSPSVDFGNIVNINVFTSMCDDFDFGYASLMAVQNLSVYPPVITAPIVAPDIPDKVLSDDTVKLEAQAGTEDPLIDPVLEENQPHHETEITQFSSDCYGENYSKVFFGESVGSVRSLIRRYCHCVQLMEPAVAGSARFYVYRIWKLLLFRGYDPAGLHLTSNGTPFNYSNWTYLHYFMLPYAGWRGAVRYKIHFGGISAQNGSNWSGLYFVSNGGDSNFPDGGTLGSTVSTNPSFAARSKRAFHMLASTGIAYAVNYMRPFLEVETPFYDNTRFLPTSKLNRLNASLRQSIVIGREFFTALSSEVRQNEIFVAGGEDMSFFFWIGMPPLYESPDPAAPP